MTYVILICACVCVAPFPLHPHGTQSAAMSTEVIDEAAIYACVAYPSPSEIRTLLEWLLNEPISAAYQSEFMFACSFPTFDI